VLYDQKKKIMTEWQNIWEQTKLSTPIKHYKEVQPYVSTKPWYNKYILPQAMIRTIIELRTQKGYHNPLLYLSGKCNTSECGITNNKQHRLLECLNNREGITELYKKLKQLKVQLPISLSTLLWQKQQEIVTTLYKHYKQCRTQPENKNK
jgi:hypothetical protein